MKVAIAGYGIEGAASYQYWLDLGHDVTILDERPEAELTLPERARVVTGYAAFSDLSQYDIVVRTAGLSPQRLEGAHKIWSATNEFFEHCPAPIIGVTGTKGKGTTASMIAAILRASGRIVHLVGNIGTPALDVLPTITQDDLVVYELSSFQLWDLERSPHIAVVLMIEPDHLDVHADFEEYLAAKSNICRYQTIDDLVVYNQQNEFSAQITNTSEATKLPYPFAIDQFISCIKVPGEHNRDNAAAAIGAVREYVQDPEVICSGLGNFTGLPHRLKLIRQVDAVDYYDDSISTTPGSAIAALKAFPDRPKIIILGGSDKGASYESVVQQCVDSDTKVVAIGSTGESIAKLCRNLNVECERVTGGMSEVVKRARSLATEGSLVILSPASASFDQYKNYADRGDRFISAVNQL